MQSESELKITELKMLRATEHFKSVISMAELALKSSILVNGGAAVALLTFIGKVTTGDKSLLVYALLSFSIGVLMGAIATFLAYLAQYHFMEQINSEVDPKDNESHKNIAIKVCGFSFFCFFVGIICVSGGVLATST
jgi:hypothetical protein